MDVAKEDDKIEIPPLIVIKKDGSTIYATRDLATIYSRMERFNPDEICYVVDNRQGMYFKQVFRSSYKSGLVKEDTELNFYGFGTMNGSDGKPFKTRDGGVMELRQLISMVSDVTYTKLKETIVGEERKELADKLAIAVLKYADLSPLRNTDYIFDVDKFSSLEGKTGPYILYTAVRINSIFAKLAEKKDNYDIKNIYSEEELNIYLKLIELTKTIDNAFNEKSLSGICDYLFNLANLYNKFYSEHNILNEQDEDKKETYLALSKLTYSVIEKLLNVLAIDMIDKM
jgi:arginyl-tRNA synthetase